MSTREKANKGKVLKYIQEQFENAKEINYFKCYVKKLRLVKTVLNDM
jgi:hypothetical protein